MKSVELHYALPLSRLRISSTVTTSNDSVLKEVTVAPQSTVALEVGASKETLVLRASMGLVFNTGVALELTDEGLLTSTALESGGEMGKIVLAAVGAATTLAAAALSPATLAAGLTLQDRRRTIVEGQPDKAPASREEIEAAAFAEGNRVAAALLERSRSLVARIGEERLQVLERLLESDSLEETTALQNKLFRLERLLRAVESQLDVLNESFKAWRATTIETKTEEYERLLSLDEVRAAKAVVRAGELHFGGDASDDVRFAWSKLGVAFAVEPTEAETAAELQPEEENQVLVRVPRRVTLNVYEQQQDRAVLKESKSHLVMDSACEVRAVKLRKSAWAKRSVSLGFGDLGELSSYKIQGDSSAAAIASAAGSLPATVTDSLERGLKTRQLLASLDQQGLEQQLARVKAEAELKQQEVTKVGLAATSADFASLERLKQRAEMLQQRKTIRESRYSEPETDPIAAEVAALKQQVELLKLQAQLDKLS